MKTIRYWGPVILVIGAIYYISSLSQSEIPTIDLPGLDKFAHLLMYSTLGFVFGRALTSQLRAEASWILYRNRLLISAIVTILYGVFDEWHQSFVPGRSVEALDLLMDAVGGFIGSGLVLFYRAWVIQYEKKKTHDHAS